MPDSAVATDLNELGWALAGLARAAEALPLHQRALRIREAALGPDHPFTRHNFEYVEARDRLYKMRRLPERAHCP